ncbi:MAG: hypothetical protein HQ519_00815 [Planctomycetes bacterium]|nr:hypothetical protein [Planctomycetota bacterium]
MVMKEQHEKLTARKYLAVLSTSAWLGSTFPKVTWDEYDFHWIIGLSHAFLYIFIGYLLSGIIVGRLINPAKRPLVWATAAIACGMTLSAILLDLIEFAISGMFSLDSILRSLSDPDFRQSALVACTSIAIFTMVVRIRNEFQQLAHD